MRGIDLPHANQYHLGSCGVCLAVGAGPVEALTVILGSHLCADCATRVGAALTPVLTAPAAVLAAMKNHPTHAPHS